jgi:protein-tyrosine-phosphatase
MNILFICRHNKFRSKIAEAYFNKINQNENLKAESAGIFQGSYPFSETEMAIGENLGINIVGKPRAISTDLLRWQDVIIAITDDLPEGLFNYGTHNYNVIRWEIKDNYDGDKEEIENIVNEIINRVEEFVKEKENEE